MSKFESIPKSKKQKMDSSVLSMGFVDHVRRDVQFSQPSTTNKCLAILYRGFLHFLISVRHLRCPDLSRPQYQQIKKLTQLCCVNGMYWSFSTRWTGFQPSAPNKCLKILYRGFLHCFISVRHPRCPKLSRSQNQKNQKMDSVVFCQWNLLIMSDEMDSFPTVNQ